MNDYEQANLLYQETPNNLRDYNRVMEFVKHFLEYQQPRLKRLDAYYRGKNEGILGQTKRRMQDGYFDYRLTHPFAQEIADFHTSFSVGNPIGIETTENNHEKLDEVDEFNDVDNLNAETYLDMTKFGRAFELVYRGDDTEGMERIVRLNPTETFMIYSTDVDPKPLMAVRVVGRLTIDEENNHAPLLKYVIETWDNERHVTSKPMQKQDQFIAERVENVVTLPVVEYWNNSLRIGDYEPVLSLIDAYDAAQSDTANYMSDLNDAMLVIQGDIDTLFEGADLMVDPTDAEAAKKLAYEKQKMLQEMKDARMLLLRSGISATGSQTSVDAKYVYKQYDVNGVEAYKNRLYKNIHTFSRTPDISDENFASNASGVAMKYKQLGVIQLAATKRRQFEKGMYARYKIIQDLEQFVSGGWNINYRDIRFTFKDNLPTDDITTVQTLVQAGATLPQEYLYRFLPGGVDVDEVQDMMDKQNENADYMHISERLEAVNNDDNAGEGLSADEATD